MKNNGVLVTIISIVVGIVLVFLGGFIYLEINKKDGSSVASNIGISQKKLDKLLYEISYDDLDDEYGYNALLTKYTEITPGCSTVRNGNIFGRNYDWYLDDHAEFVVHVKKSDKRHASIGVAYTSLSNVKASGVLSEEEKKLIPFGMTDGINDAGVAISINVVSADPNYHTTSTHPDKPTLHILGVVRYILDNAGSVDEAIYLLNEKNIINPVSPNVKGEFHFMIADSNRTVVIEFVNNEMKVLEDEKILTNFYLHNYNKTSGALPEYAMGIERYHILENGLATAVDKNSMQHLLKNVYYTKAYDLYTTPFWYSEFEGIYKNGALTLNSSNRGAENLNGSLEGAGEYAYILDIAIKRFNEQTYGESSWLTVHSSVYDLSAKTLALKVQEKDKEYIFTLN